MSEEKDVWKSGRVGCAIKVYSFTDASALDTRISFNFSSQIQVGNLLSRKRQQTQRSSSLTFIPRIGQFSVTE